PAVHERGEGAEHPDRRQVGHGRAGRHGRATLVVHRLRPGRPSAGRDRGDRRARRAGRSSRGAARWRPPRALLQDVRPMTDPSRRPGADPALDEPTGADRPPEPRPWLERIGLAAIALVMGMLLSVMGITAWL